MFQCYLFSQIIPPTLFFSHWVQKSGLYVWKIWNASWICMSSLRRAHAKLLCIVPTLVYMLLKRARSAGFPYASNAQISLRTLAMPRTHLVCPTALLAFPGGPQLSKAGAWERSPDSQPVWHSSLARGRSLFLSAVLSLLAPAALHTATRVTFSDAHWLRLFLA